MTKWILGLAVAATLVLAPAAEAHTTIIEPMGSHFPYQRWIDESLVPTPDVTIEVIATEFGHGCPARQIDAGGCTSPEERKIWLDEPVLTFMAENGGERTVRWVFMHEMGHNFDLDGYLPEWARGWFMQLYGLGGPWLVLAEPQPTDVPDELFADVYSGCSFEPYVSKSRMAETPGPIDGAAPLFGFRMTYNKACRMLRNL